MTGSENNRLTQSVEPVFHANYVLAFVGDTRRPGDEMCERVNRVESQPEASMADDKLDEKDRWAGWTHHVTQGGK